LIKKHVRPRREGEKGQRIEIPGKINVSNAMLVCPKCGKATRVGHKSIGEKKVRVCKKCGAEI
jgi:large subunit ribosomal protein L24